METVPSLCASGTLGIAAVGFALGQPHYPSAIRPTSKKRKMPSLTALQEVQNGQGKFTTPLKVQQPVSASTSRLRKRKSIGRPLTALGDSRDGVRTLGSTPEAKLNGFESKVIGQPSVQESTLGPFEHGSFPFEFKSSENTPPSWLKRMSTLSSLKSGSIDPSPRPGSPSISYSNGSSAPILSSPLGHSPTVSSRNKLVKRSSSQRALYGSNALHSTIRRPATSHQRSATLQQFQQDEPPGRSSLAASSILPSESLEPQRPYDESSEQWQPFFTPQAGGNRKDGPLRKRNPGANTSWNETIKTVVPEVTEVATLLLATSISPQSTGETINRRASNISSLSRPFTQMGIYENRPAAENIQSQSTDGSHDLKSRNSFSLSEIFPSPSPSSWKMPRTTSTRRTKPLIKAGGGRRAVSAPQANNHNKATSFVSGDGSMDGPNIGHNDIDHQASSIKRESHSQDSHQGGSSSPLPPLNRLSAFEIELPDATPSYPTTPQPPPASSPSVHSSHSRSSPFASLVIKPRAQRYSSVPSEPGSTLLGSDNDNSRILSGDEEDIDSRSETIYDSTRTGATGSSSSGIRRPPIDTIFDESPPPGLPSRKKLIDLDDLLPLEGSLLRSERQDVILAGNGQEMPTPIQASTPCKDEDSPTPMRDTNEIFLSPEPPSPSSPLEAQSHRSHDRSNHRDNDEDLWSFENAAISTADHIQIRKVSLSSGVDASPGQLPRTSPVIRRHNSPPSAGKDNALKSKIFEWSEQPMTDKDSTQGDSPRPKTVHGRQGKDIRGAHLNGRRGSNALHLRSQSVPVHKDMASRRSHNNAAKLDSWVLGNKGPSEDWDGDFEFEELPHVGKQASGSHELMRPSLSAGMLVPRDILERQASFHGQFSHVKELTLLVEELKRLQQQAGALGIMDGQSAELWKEAEGIINLATLDDEEREVFPPRSPCSPNFELDPFDEESPSLRSRQRSALSPPREDRSSGRGDASSSKASTRILPDTFGFETPPHSRPRKESSAKAKSVLETIQHDHYDSTLLDAPFAQKKLPFDTTSLKDLVVRAGVVLRALKEIVRQANGSETPDPRSPTPKDPPYISQMFHQPPLSSPVSKSPRIVQSPKSSKSSKSSKSPKSQRSGSFIGGSIAGNDNEINGHMKMMTVV